MSGVSTWFRTLSADGRTDVLSYLSSLRTYADRNDRRYSTLVALLYELGKEHREALHPDPVDWQQAIARDQQELMVFLQDAKWLSREQRNGMIMASSALEFARRVIGRFHDFNAAVAALQDAVRELDGDAGELKALSDRIDWTRQNIGGSP